MAWALNRPDANITGSTFFTGSLGPKRLELLRELVPKATTIAMLVDPDNPASAADEANVQTAAHALGQQIKVLHVTTGLDIDIAFALLARELPDALFIGTGALFFNQRDTVVALATRYAVPAIYADREIAEAGGLISYGASRTDAYHQAGIYAGRILKGEKPADLPVVLPTKFELVINLKTAKALGLAVPPTVLARADAVIE